MCLCVCIDMFVYICIFMCVCVYRYVCIYFVSMFVSQVTAEEIKDKRAIVLELEAKNLDKKVKHSLSLSQSLYNDIVYNVYM